MKTRTSFPPSIALASFAVAALALPAAALAVASSSSSPTEVHGTVTSFDGRYALAVHTKRGNTIGVVLHDGTVLVPRGLKLHPGLAVTVVGSGTKRAYAASQIVAPMAMGNGSKLGDGPAQPNGFYQSETPDFYAQHNGW